MTSAGRCQPSDSGSEDDSINAVDETDVGTYLLHERTGVPAMQAIVRVRQLRCEGLSFQLWPAAAAVCSYLEERFGVDGLRVNGMRAVGDVNPRPMQVLELGSGTGLVGIVAACMGAHVVVTDLPHVIPNISFNVELNRSTFEAAGGKAEARALCWGVEDDVRALGPLSFDLILASDCIYHSASHKTFLDTLKWLTVQAAITSEMPKVSDSRALELPHDGERLSVDSSDRLKPGLVRESGGRECMVVLGHTRRWRRKSSRFFRMASKFWDFEAVHRHAPCDETVRVGPIVYSLTSKLPRSRRDAKGTNSTCACESK